MNKQLIMAIVGGIVLATALDFQAFKSFKTYHEFIRYDWKTAAFRIFQGIVIGAASYFGGTALAGN